MRHKADWKERKEKARVYNDQQDIRYNQYHDSGKLMDEKAIKARNYFHYVPNYN